MLTTFICEHCNKTETDTHLCEGCKAELQQVAQNTEINPTSGQGVVRFETGGVGGRGSYVVYNDTDRSVARISNYDKSTDRQISDAVMVAFAWEMWEIVSESARNNLDDEQALGLIARADAMYQRLIAEE